MARVLVTGNQAAGETLAVAGEANRTARGCAAGAYPITPQTEIIEIPAERMNFDEGAGSSRSSPNTARWASVSARRSAARGAFTASSVERPGVYERKRLRRGLLPPADCDDRRESHARPAVEHLGRSGRQLVTA